MTTAALLRSRIAAAVMAALAIAPALWITGCEDHRSGSASVQPPARVVLAEGRMLRLYGRVNDWPWIDEAVLLEEVAALDKAGWDGYLVELGGAARWRGHSEEEARALIGERYPVLVDALGDRGMVLLVSVQNDNAGKAKFGDKSPPLSGQVGFSAWLVNLVASVGRPDVAMVQPVAETESDAGYALERLCASVLTNFTLVNNAGSRPSFKPAWAHYNATHNWSIAKVYDEDIVVNDTSTAIIEVDADGNMDGPTNPHQVARFLARCEEVGAKAAGVYVFSHDGPIDHSTIQGVPR